MILSYPKARCAITLIGILLLDNVTAFSVASRTAQTAQTAYIGNWKSSPCSRASSPTICISQRISRHCFNEDAQVLYKSFTALQATPASVSLSLTSSATSLSPLALWYMLLLAIQFGSQPILTRMFTPKTITRSTVVMMQDVVKVVLSFLLMMVTHNAPAIWSIREWLTVAGIPASLYVVQNYCSLMAYQNLPAVTYNVLNQTKTLSAAICCYFLLGARQSNIQILSLFVLGLAALVLEGILPLQQQPQQQQSQQQQSLHQESLAPSNHNTRLTMGILPVLLASFLSGLAGAFSQRSLHMGRNAYLFSMELSAASLLVLFLSLVFGETPDSKRIRDNGFWNGWTWQTWIPIVTQASGGIIVGLVTKHAGTVRKGFGLMLGLFLSGVLQAHLSKDDSGDGGVTLQQIVGGSLAGLSLYLHSKFPVVVACAMK